MLMVRLSSRHGFEVRPGIIRAPNGAKRVEGFFKRVGYHARRSAKSSRAAARYSRGYYQSQSKVAWSRRVMVKVSIVKMAGKGFGAQRAHLKYIERDGLGEDHERGILYSDGDRVSANDWDMDRELDENELETLARDRELITPADFLARSKEDRHQFRLIISPEDSHQITDLKRFSRDLVRQMEKELGTKLDWVAANHYDTAQPHIHMVIRGRRDDGKDLVMPPDYITHGIRSQAQELVTMELGPINEFELQQRRWDGVHKERLTFLDHKILSLSENHEIDLTTDKARRTMDGHLLRDRLGRLTDMGLAEPLGKGRWRLDPEMGPTLKRMGERGDIIKQLRKDLKKQELSRLVDSRSVYDPADRAAQTLTGRLIDGGTHGDLHQKGYVVIDSLEGRAVYVDIGSNEKLSGLKPGMIMSVEPHPWEPKPSDRTIETVARQNNNLYGYKEHQRVDLSVRIKYVEAHLRRLHALERAGIVKRIETGEFRIPEDYLERCSAHEFEKAKRRGPEIRIDSKLTLSQQTQTRGRTWLDQQLRDHPEQNPHSSTFNTESFGKGLQQARQARRQFLFEQGMTQSLDMPVTDQHLDKLEAMDVQDTAKAISKEYDLSFNNDFNHGRVEGELMGSIERPSGKYAVIQRAREFSLVPWSDELSRKRGRHISGQVMGRSIRWDRGRDRGLGR